MSVKTTQYDGIAGGWNETGSFSVTPGSVSAASQVITTATITGAKVGDLIFANAEALPLMAALVGAKITAPNTVSLYFNNMYDSSTAVTLGATVIDYILFHLT